LTLQQLLYFRAAAELGSFNAAARSLHCTQPAVSDQVRRLERELGVSLFTRAGRGLTLTGAGRVFLSHAERVTAAAGDALASVGRRHAERDRVVSVGTFRNAPYYDIAGLAARFHAAHPDARLRLPGPSSALVPTAVADGQLEAGLVVLPVDDGRLDVAPLFTDEVLLVSADPERTRTPAAVGHLAQAPLILYDTGHGGDDAIRRQLAARAQAAGDVIEARIEVEHVETALALVSRGLGDTIAARAVIRAARVAAPLYSAGFSEPLHDRFALVTRRGAKVSPETVALSALVQAWARSVARRLAT